MRPTSLTVTIPAATACLLIAFANSEARILNVPEDFETIQRAIDAREADDTILVHPGEYNERLDVRGGNLVLGSLTMITGDPAYIDSTIIDAQGEGPVVNLGYPLRMESRSIATLRGLTLRNGSSRELGGGIMIGGFLLVHLSDLLITNNSGGQAGGILGFSFFELTMERVTIHDNAPCGMIIHAWDITIQDCEISANRRGGAALASAFMHLERVALIDNINGTGLHIGEMGDNRTALIQNVTISGTQGGAGLRLAGDDEESYSVDVALTNSIIQGNANGEIALAGMGRNGTTSISIAYCDIAGGEEEIDLEGNSSVDWLAGNIDADPLFVDPDNGDYHLTEDSPCIDSGDPESDPDADGTRTDMGAFPFFQRGGFIGGVVLDARTDQPVANAELVATDVLINEIPRNFIWRSDEQGKWGGWLNLVFEDTIHFDFGVTAPRYCRGNFQADLAPDDSLWIEVRLEQARFIPSLDSLVAEVDSGSFRQVPLTIRNDGNGLLTWSAASKNRGEGGLDPFSFRESIPIGEITDDDRIEGVAFDGERYFASGANGNDSNLIYILNRNGELLGDFPQVGSSRYGYRDLEWDGEYLWAVGEDSIYALTTDGMVTSRFADPLNPSTYIAYDPAEGIIWLSGTTTSIVAVDRLGNHLGQTLNRSGLRIYGLAWLPDDPDSAHLYIINRPAGVEAPTQLYKMNVRTGDTLLVNTFPLEDGVTGIQSAFICRNFDKYQGSVLMTISNRAEVAGGDRLDVYQLFANTEWLSVTPDRGEIPAGGELEVEVILKAIADDGDWNFDLGEYEGEILFANDGEEGDVILPVLMRVINPNNIETESTTTSITFGLTACYPNPFNSSTTIRFSKSAQSAQSAVRLAVYGLDGRLVQELVKENLAAGAHSVVWNAAGLPGGIYLVRLESGAQSRTAKVILLK